MLNCQKSEFFIPEDIHYLNCAYMSPTSRAVEAAGIEGIRAKRVPNGIKPDHFFEKTRAIKASFARLVNAPAEAISIIPSASYGIATAAQNLPLSKGQNIVMAGEQFPSNVYAWMRKADEAGAEIRFVDPPEPVALSGTDGRGSIWNQRILEAIDADTAIVTMANVHWADGTLFDLERISQRAREVGASFVIDGTQSVGALPFDVAALQPDALICAGYKWLLGPYSLGVAYYGPKLADGRPLEENWITREGSENFSGLVEYRSTYQPGASRFDVGENSNFILQPMLLQALHHLELWRVDRIQQYCKTLSEPFCDEVQTLGFQVEETNWRAHHLFGVRVRDDIPMERLMEALKEAHVSVSIRGTAVRISPNVYNDANDMGVIADVFTTIARSRPARHVI